VAKLVEHALVHRLEAALLGRSEVVREREPGEVSQRRADGLQVALDLSRTRRADRRGGLGMQVAERVAAQRGPVGLVGRLVGVGEGQGIARSEAVALDAPQDRVLVLASEPAQRAGERDADDALPELALGSRRQAGAQLHAALDPVALVAEQARDPGRREVIVADEGADNPGLVERRDGPRRRVGGEQQSLVLGRRGRALDDHGDEPMARLEPARQAAEPVNDLVLAGGDRDRA
jgi:hypothetical protein